MLLKSFVCFGGHLSFHTSSPMESSQLSGRSNRSNGKAAGNSNISLQADPVEESHNGNDDGNSNLTRHVFPRVS